MTPLLTILSLGWGVQSWTLAAMAALGELPKPDYEAQRRVEGWVRTG